MARRRTLASPMTTEHSTPRLSDLTNQQITNVRSLDYVRLVACAVEARGMDPKAAWLYQQKYSRSFRGDVVAKAFVTKAA